MRFFLILLALVAGSTQAQVTPDRIDRLAAEAQPQVVEWRRWFHQNPELSNREFNTSVRIAEILTEMGLEPRTGIAGTGIVAVIEGGKPGPLVALRTDMDGLPVTEQTGLPFASTARSEYNGQEVGVMHACGHDAHTAILLGVAQVFADRREQLAGTLMLVFQPAEEGAPPGEEGGAQLMLKEGLFDKILKPDAMFGLHVWSGQTVGQLAYRPGPMMASGDRFQIIVRGVQTHGSRPWAGVDPISVAAQIVQGLDSIAARQIDVTKAPAVISIGSIQGGIRFNIIPDTVTMSGTVRSFDEDMRQDIARRIERTAGSIAEASGASAEVDYDFLYPVTVNDPALTARSVPVLQQVAGADNVIQPPLVTAAEDFSFYQREVPGFWAEKPPLAR